MSCSPNGSTARDGGRKVPLGRREGETAGVVGVYLCGGGRARQKALLVSQHLPILNG